jgi:regulator of sigma E protease
MEIIKHLALFIVALLILISLHEWGHYIVAKRCGVGVLRFSVGFGKPLWSKTDQHGTQWCIAPILLGGYVQLLDQREAPVAPERIHESFDQQSKIKRSAIILAGPIMNFILGIALIWASLLLGTSQTKTIIANVIPDTTASIAGLKTNDEIISLDHTDTPTWPKFMLALLQHAGDDVTLPITVLRQNQRITTELDLSTWHLGTLKPHPLRNLGLEPIRPIIDSTIANVQPGSPAEIAGLQPRDKILSLNQEPIDDWYELAEMIHDRPNQTLTLKILRDQKTMIIHVNSIERFATNFKRYGQIGIQPPKTKLADHFTYSPNHNALTAIVPAIRDTLAFAQFHCVVLGKIILGKISVQSLGGPIALYHFADIAIAQGIAKFCSFLAIISIMLACINLFPIPGLDGGHLAFIGYEAIRESHCL